MNCTFCFQSQTNSRPVCQDNPGHGCSYGFHHEFGDEGTKEKPKQAQTKAPDKQICMSCGLHVRNPAGATNGCQHQYPS